MISKNRLGSLEVNLARAIKAKQLDDHDDDDLDLDSLDLANKIKKLEGDFSRLLKAKKAKEAKKAKKAREARKAKEIKKARKVELKAKEINKANEAELKAKKAKEAMLAELKTKKAKEAVLAEVVQIFSDEDDDEDPTAPTSTRSRAHTAFTSTRSKAPTAYTSTRSRAHNAQAASTAPRCYKKEEAHLIDISIFICCMLMVLHPPLLVVYISPTTHHEPLIPLLLLPRQGNVLERSLTVTFRSPRAFGEHELIIETTCSSFHFLRKVADTIFSAEPWTTRAILQGRANSVLSYFSLRDEGELQDLLRIRAEEHLRKFAQTLTPSGENLNTVAPGTERTSLGGTSALAEQSQGGPSPAFVKENFDVLTTMIKELDNRGQEKVTPFKLFNEKSGGVESENSQMGPSAEEVGGYSSNGSSKSRSRGRPRSAQKHRKSASRKKGISKSHRPVRSEARSKSKSKSVKLKPQSVRVSGRNSSSDSGYDTVSDSGSEDLSMPYRSGRSPKYLFCRDRARGVAYASMVKDVLPDHKWYDKDPTEIHGIKRKPNEGLQAFMDRVKAESAHIKGVPLVLRISAFIHGHGHPELAKKINDKIPKTVDEMWERNSRGDEGHLRSRGNNKRVASLIKMQRVASHLKSLRDEGELQDLLRIRAEEHLRKFAQTLAPSAGENLNTVAPGTERTPLGGTSAPAEQSQGGPSPAFVKENIDSGGAESKNSQMGPSAEEVGGSKSKSVKLKPQSVRVSRRKSSSDSGSGRSPKYLFCRDQARGMAYASMVQDALPDPKWYDKDPTEIHGIKRKPNEGLQAFMDRVKAESMHIKGVPLVLRISAFMHGHGHPELAKKLNDKIPKTVDEMWERVRAFIRGETAADTTEVIRSPRWKKSADRGHNTNGCYHLKKQIEEEVASGRLAHLVKDIRRSQLPLGVIDLEVIMGECGKTRTVIMEFAMVESPSPYNALLATIATTRETLRECSQIEEVQALSQHSRVTDPTLMQTSSEVANPRVSLAPMETRSRRPGMEPMQLNDMEERAITEHSLDIYPHIKPKAHKKRRLALDRRKMTKKDKEKTTFHTEEGVSCYTKMPFGLKNAGATYQRLVDSAFKEQIEVNLEAYVDDMVIKSRTEQDIIKYIEQTFSTLQRINMKLNSKKCSFGMEEGKFLGYIVTSEGITLNRFLSKSIERSLPLLDTLKKCTNKKDFRWTEAAEAALLEMKNLVSKLPTLTTLEKGETMMMYLDAANETVSTVILMERNGRQCLYTMLVSIFARGRNKLRSDRETRSGPSPCSQTVKERLYTDGASNNGGSGAGLILIAPDDVEYSYALRLNFSNSNNEAEYKALLAGLWITIEMQVKDIHAFVDSKLLASQVEGSYEAKVENRKADALSKLAAVQFDHLSKEVLMEVMNERYLEAQEVNMVVEEEGPTWMTPIRNYQKKGILSEDPVDARTMMEKIGSYTMKDGVLYRKSYLVPLMRNDKVSNVATNYFTKWMEAKPLATITGKPVVNFTWDNIVCRLGIPATIITDNGTQFVNDPFKKLEKGGSTWAEEVPNVLWAHRTKMKTSNGETPFGLTYGASSKLRPAGRTKRNNSYKEAKYKQHVEMYYNKKGKRYLGHGMLVTSEGATCKTPGYLYFYYLSLPEKQFSKYRLAPEKGGEQALLPFAHNKYSPMNSYIGWRKQHDNINLNVASKCIRAQAVPKTVNVGLPQVLARGLQPESCSDRVGPYWFNRPGPYKSRHLSEK
nr:hypothetical protein [Tanacetum cinerariifolium]